MNTYLFVWNPKRYDWYDLEDHINQIEKTGKTEQRWGCGNTKSIEIGDRVFLVKLGTEPKGIIGAGFTTTRPFLAKNLLDESKEKNNVLIDFEILLNPNKDPFLSLDLLNSGNLIKQYSWTPQASGITVRPDIVDELEAVWFNFLTTQNIRFNPFIPTDNGEQKAYAEGTPNQVTLTKYERNPFARKACIEHYGLSCSVCTFNFAQYYGDIGKDFIHVHHLAQVAKIGMKYTVDPIKDLRPVCPNCHAMIHKGKEAISIEEMKSLIRTEKHSH